MKYGNFVGKYNIPFTAEEKKEIGKEQQAKSNMRGIISGVYGRYCRMWYAE